MLTITAAILEENKRQDDKSKIAFVKFHDLTTKK